MLPPRAGLGGAQNELRPRLGQLHLRGSELRISLGQPRRVASHLPVDARALALEVDLTLLQQRRPERRPLRRCQLELRRLRRALLRLGPHSLLLGRHAQLLVLLQDQLLPLGRSLVGAVQCLPLRGHLPRLLLELSGQLRQLLGL